MKQYLTLAVALLAVSTGAWAQENDADESPAQGQILVPLKIVPQAPLNLGVVDRTSGTVIIDPAGSQSAVFKVTGDEGDAVFFNVPANILMSWQDPGDGSMAASGAPTTLNFMTNTKVKHFSKDFGPPDPVTAFSPHPLSTQFQDGSGAEGGLNAGAPATQDGEGQMFVYVGGQYSPSAAQQRGTYKGIVPLAVNYQ